MKKKQSKQSIDFNELGDTCKRFERAGTQARLLEGAPIVARLDGHKFSKFCKGLTRPYDVRMSDLMKDTAKFLLERYNADLSYTQSDEITLVWKNQKIPSTMPFNSKPSKLNSLLAASATAFFNQNLDRISEKTHLLPEFDSRIWSVPNLEIAAKTVMWREMDATRNSISMAAQSNFSHKSLQHVNQKCMLMMLEEKGIIWGNYPDFFKKGSYFAKVTETKIFTDEERSELPLKHFAHANPDLVFKRSVVRELDIKPLTKCKDIVATLFGEQS